MDYLALYRKYRPNELNDVVGQEEIKRILSSSVKNGTITHAYLFSGPRGTGKTTMAKIFAKMVNCENPVDGDVCNKCNSCLNILNSSDVIEIDAASNNGVDEIRELREKANLVPTMCKYKVYIIDEVHMLTTQAFNALLKTLEEPPKHVIFILATTEYYKIPLTITSRCQKFQFNKLKVDEIVDRLSFIAKKEKINIDKDSLYAIAKISDGGMRDSINFLDQLRSFSNKKVTIDDVYDVCGNVSVNDIVNLLYNIRNDNLFDVTTFFEKMDESGKNYGKFFEDIVDLLKNVILFKRNVSSKYIVFDEEYIKKIADIYSVDDILYLIDEINKIMDRLKNISRQSIVVISNFLLIMHKLNCTNIENQVKSNIVKSEENNSNNDYEMAFDFTSDKENVDSKPDVKKNVEESKNNEINVKNRKIIINNVFAVASKQVKKDLLVKFRQVDSYLTDNKFSVVAGLLIDMELQVAGDKYILFSSNYDTLIDKFYNNYKLCNDFINMLFGDSYNIVAINNDEWEKYRDEYILNVKNGKKYELLDLIPEKKEATKESKKKNTVVDKLFDLVGEDIVEFK